MAKVSYIVAASALAVVLATPVIANATLPGIATSIPEPSDFMLFLMGVAGLVIGRRSSRRRRGNDDDTNA